ncbi:uncharacterized protein LOC118213831 isoform X2 [Anguilla anguilla]|uniref:uncharacterized protein LOC118213831 isoform X2 n=1 Tax=Anguilla anguilla TaxID=7936 RepID=UPI0015AA9CC3|nr:uncharacterized protein LOC118213831 isoform X2 [Anguilla anguilla]
MNMWSPWIFLSGMVGLCFGEAYPYGGQCAVCLEEGCKTGTLHFEGKDGASGGGKTFHSTNMPCADLDLPPSLKSSSGAPDLNQINATANPTTTHASAWPPWKIAITVCGSVFAVIVIIGVSAIVIYRRRHKRRREGQDGERPPDNNVEMDPLNRDDEHS